MDELNVAVKYWQHKLGLRSWHTTVEIVGSSRLTHGTLGDIDTDSTTRTAVIRVLDTHDSGLRSDQARADQLVTVAHEMVHLKRLVKDRSPNWKDEGATVRETYDLLVKHHPAARVDHGRPVTKIG